MSTLTRRGFLGMLGACAAACALPVLHAEEQKGVDLFQYPLQPIDFYDSDTGIYGLRYWQEPIHIGNWSGISRSVYPGRTA